MANNFTTTNDNLFSSLISDVKNYNGTDPLLPWLRGIKKLGDSLPTQLLKQKLPRFLQKCVQTFETDLRYHNDIRYLRVWMKLLDYVDDPGAVLEHMKANHIGNKRSLFYIAYALYYEKMKKFTAAEKMYHLGLQNLAEPADELQKSFDQFLLRLEKYKNKKIQHHGGLSIVKPKDNVPSNKLTLQKAEDKNVILQSKGRELDEHAGENTVVVRFTKTAIVGKSEAEDACHHGLVEPTINTKEAMDAINSMFRAPLGPEPFQKYNSNKSKANDFKVFNDNDSDEIVDPSYGNQPVEEPFQIYCDDNNDDDEDDENIGLNDTKGTNGAYVFPNPNVVSLECSKDTESRPVKFREDTVVYRFVGSTISDEPKVENVCHHGLVEPTVNLKEAMDDINSMFGKPIEYVRKRRPRKQEKQQICSSAFSILPDDDESDHVEEKTCKPSGSFSRKDSDLFEQTVCTKQAMDDINKMFAMPLDF